MHGTKPWVPFLAGDMWREKVKIPVTEGGNIPSISTNLRHPQESLLSSPAEDFPIGHFVDEETDAIEALLLFLGGGGRDTGLRTRSTASR